MLGGLFAQYLPDVSQMSETEKMLVFENNKKSPALGVLFSLLLPSTGHAYAGNWREGLFFTAGQASALPIGFIMCRGAFNDENTACEILGWTSISTMAVLRVWEIIDAGKEVKRYNNNVYRKIFDREPPSFSLNLQPTYQGANLTMSYSFK